MEQGFDWHIQVFNYVGFEILCCACGIGAATISFTAWCIILPFMFTVMSFPLYKALFLSVLSDLTSCAFLTILFTFKRKVIYSTWIFGVLQIPVAVGVALYLGHYLEKFQSFLKKNLNILMLGMAVFYFFRFVFSFVKEYRAKKKKKKKRERKLARKLQKEYELEKVHVENSSANNHNDEITIEPPEEEFNNETPLSPLSPSSSEGEEDNSPMVLASKKNPFEFFTVEEGAGVFNQGYTLWGSIWRHTAFVIWASCTAALGGFLKNGGGLNFNILLQVLYKQNQVVATATGCFLCFILCAALQGSFFTMPELFDQELLVYSGLCITCSIIGCIMGSSIILLLSEMYIYLLIGFICLVLGIIPIVLQIYTRTS